MSPKILQIFGQKKMKSLAVSNIIQTKSIFQASMCLSEAVARRCSVEKVSWEILQNSQENTCSRVSGCEMRARLTKWGHTLNFCLKQTDGVIQKV